MHVNIQGCTKGKSIYVCHLHLYLLAGMIPNDKLILCT